MQNELMKNGQNQFIKELVLASFKEELSQIDCAEAELNLDKWNPTESDIEFVIKDIQGLAQSQIEDCNEPELAEESYKLIDKIKNAQTIEEKRELMQGHLIDTFYSVPTDMIHQCYGKEYATFLEKALGVKYITKNEVIERFMAS